MNEIRGYLRLTNLDKRNSRFCQRGWGKVGGGGGLGRGDAVQLPVFAKLFISLT